MTGSNARRSLGHHPKFVVDMPKCFGAIVVGVVLHFAIMARDQENRSGMHTSFADGRTLAPTAIMIGVAYSDRLVWVALALNDGHAPRTELLDERPGVGKLAGFQHLTDDPVAQTGASS